MDCAKVDRAKGSYVAGCDVMLAASVIVRADGAGPRGNEADCGEPGTLSSVDSGVRLPCADLTVASEARRYVIG